LSLWKTEDWKALAWDESIQRVHRELEDAEFHAIYIHHFSVHAARVSSSCLTEDWQVSGDRAYLG
jgi:hypothetical protein